MKDTIQHSQAEERMAPGSITAQGFLGGDTRHLAGIIESDEEEFRRQGLSFEAVAMALERLRDEGEKGLGEPITVEGRWLVQTGDARGKLPCPWEDGIHHKNSIWLRRIDSGESLVYSDLSIHMLREHHFLQGRGSPFRLEPAVLSRILAAG
jgi:hypothetical protein